MRGCFGGSGCSMSKRENFYRRDPGAALAGMAGMSLEERGVYNTVIDLLYLTWRPIEDNRGYIAGHCKCAVQKLNPLIEKLLAKGKLLRFEEGGQAFISNPTFERERASVKGVKTRSGRANVEEKSGDVEEKSEGVGNNPPTCVDNRNENQPLTPLDKSREDKSKEAYASSVADGDGEGDFEALWKSYPHVRGRSSRPMAKAAWAKIETAKRNLLPAAAKRYKSGGTMPPGGAPALAKWLAEELWVDWLESEATAPAWCGPPNVRQAFLAAGFSEGWVRDYIDRGGWNDPDRALIPATITAREKITREAGYVLKAERLSILERAA
jgi:hypothetical protein